MGLLKKEEIPAYLEKAESSEFEVYTKEEFDKLKQNILTNAVEPEVNKKIGDRISELHTQYDNDIFEITGLRKKPEQKTYEFNKELLSGFKKDKEEYSALQIKYSDLEKSKGKGSENLASELEQVRKQAQLDNENHLKQIADLKSTGFNTQTEFAIDNVIAGLKFNPNIPESVRKSYIENVKRELIKNSENKEGNLVFKDKDGKVLLGADYTVKGVNDIVSEQLADILTTGKKGLGLGKDKKDSGSIILPDYVRDPNSLIAHMKTIPGLVMHSKEWDEMFTNLKKNFKQ